VKAAEDLSFPWKNVRKRRGSRAEELAERLERPAARALACSVRETEGCCFPLCDLLFAF